MPSVLNKNQNYDLWQSGAYGNKLRAWKTIDEYFASGFEGVVTVRWRGGGGGPCVYDLHGPSAVLKCLYGEATPLSGYDSSLLMVNESAPDESVLIQGEFLNDVLIGSTRAACFCFFYSYVPRKMRDALEIGGCWTGGLDARMKLQGLMTPSSWSDFEVLLEDYPGHVLEVSVYGRCLGDIPGRNALVWEVRRY